MATFRSLMNKRFSPAVLSRLCGCGARDCRYASLEQGFRLLEKTAVDYDMIQRNAKAIFDSKNAMAAVKDRDNIEVL